MNSVDRPLLLDLFCGAGGCAAGYAQAGFAVIGVDSRPQPRYLKSGAIGLIQHDALEVLAWLLNVECAEVYCERLVTREGVTP